MLFGACSLEEAITMKTCWPLIVLIFLYYRYLYKAGDNVLLYNKTIMTFEDYKKHFETFSKIDTAEKLAICESQYKKHLLHTEDEEYFEPIKQRLDQDIISQFERNLNYIFNFNKIKDDQFYFLTMPSFEPESLLILERQEGNYILTYVVLIKNYWSAFYADNRIVDIEKATSKSELNKTLGDKLFVLLDNTIIKAREPKVKGITIDGVVYKLSKIYAGEQKNVFKHSPGENSKSAKIIAIMQQLIDNIDTLDNAILIDIERKIDGLQN
jgi:hypothetical protein